MAAASAAASPHIQRHSDCLNAQLYKAVRHTHTHTVHTRAHTSSDIRTYERCESPRARALIRWPSPAPSAAISAVSGLGSARARARSLNNTARKTCLFLRDYLSEFLPIHKRVFFIHIIPIHAGARALAQCTYIAIYLPHHARARVCSRERAICGRRRSNKYPRKERVELSARATRARRYTSTHQ